jgi:hypothetical protein
MSRCAGRHPDGEARGHPVAQCERSHDRCQFRSTGPRGSSSPRDDEAAGAPLEHRVKRVAAGPRSSPACLTSSNSILHLHAAARDRETVFFWVQAPNHLSTDRATDRAHRERPALLGSHWVALCRERRALLGARRGRHQAGLAREHRPGPTEPASWHGLSSCGSSRERLDRLPLRVHRDRDRRASVPF